MWGNWLKDADWLNPSRVRGYLWLLAAFNIATLVLLVATSHGGVDRNGLLLGTDFLSFWAASSLTHHGGSAYDVAAHITEQRQIYAGHDGFTAFFYPPPFLLLCWPFASLGYFPSLIAWLLASGAAFWFAVRAWLGRVRWYVFAAFPPVWLTITHGQTSFLVAALLGGACWLIATRRGFLGGVLLGLAVFKPQFGLLFPLVLLASREWRAIAGAACSASAMALLATLAFGPQIWSEWLAVTGPAQEAMAQGVIPFAKMVSPFAAARLVGLGEGTAYFLQGAIALGVGGLLTHRAWRHGFTLEVAAALLVGALLTTPFVLDYDLTLLAFPLALLVMREPLPGERIVTLAAFVVGAFARPLAMFLTIPITPLVLLALFGLLIRRIDRTTAT